MYKTLVALAATVAALLGTPACAGGFFGYGHPYSGYRGYQYDGYGTAFSRPDYPSQAYGYPYITRKYDYVPVVTYRAVPLDVYHTPRLPPYYNVPPYAVVAPY